MTIKLINGVMSLTFEGDMGKYQIDALSCGISGVKVKVMQIINVGDGDIVRDVTGLVCKYAFHSDHIMVDDAMHIVRVEDYIILMRGVAYLAHGREV